MSTIESYERDSSIIVKPRLQRIDARGAPTFRTEALSQIAGYRNVVLVLDGIEGMDSTGVGCLIALLKGVPPGSQLRLVGLRPAVRAVLKLTRVDKIFAQFDTLEAALAS